MYFTCSEEACAPLGGDSTLAYTCPARKVRKGAFTCCGSDGGGGVGGRHGWNTFIILGVAGLDGSKVTVAPRSEASGEVQGVHGLGFDFAKDGLTHRLELPVHLRLAHLEKQHAVGGETWSCHRGHVTKEQERTKFTLTLIRCLSRGVHLSLAGGFVRPKACLPGLLLTKH